MPQTVFGLDPMWVATLILVFTYALIITERLNRVYSRRRAKLDPALHSAQIASLPKENW